MWPGEQQPGEQSGGQQYPSGNSPQQPQGPYGQPPNPYAQPGYQQPGYPPSGQQPPAQPPGPPPAQSPYPPAQPYGTPSPYGQPGYQPPTPPPGGYPTPQAWGPPVPGGPGGGRPPGGRSRTTVAVAIGAALAVIAAVVVTVVVVSGGDKKTDAQDTTKPTVTGTTSASPSSAPPPTSTGSADTGSSGGDEDDPRGPAGSNDVSPVIPGWQAVKRQERNSVFDVPPDWTLDSESMTIGYADESGKPTVAVGAPAYYKEDVCTDGKNSVNSASAGTKGGAGASSVQAAAENEATAWAKWAFQENGKGTVSKALNSKAFHNPYITGWQAQATMTNVPKANKCSSNGIAYAVAWLDPAQTKPTLVVWVLWARQGVSDQIAQSMVDKIESSIRPMKK